MHLSMNAGLSSFKAILVLSKITKLNYCLIFSVTYSLFFMYILALFVIGGGLPTSFSTVIATNLGISPKHF